MNSKELDLSAPDAIAKMLAALSELLRESPEVEIPLIVQGGQTKFLRISLQNGGLITFELNPSGGRTK